MWGGFWGEERERVNVFCPKWRKQIGFQVVVIAIVIVSGVDTASVNTPNDGCLRFHSLWNGWFGCGVA